MSNKADSNAQSYDWTFINSIVKRIRFNRMTKEDFSNYLKQFMNLPICAESQDPFFSYFDENPVWRPYEHDADFMQNFADSAKNNVLLVADYSKASIDKNTYNEKLVVPYGYLPPPDVPFKHVPQNHEMSFRCQRFYHNCQDTNRISNAC